MHASRIRLEVSRDEFSIDLTAWAHERKVGYLRTLRDGDRLQIADLQVCAAVPLPWPFFHTLLCHVLAPRRRSYRGRGIGSQLLATLVRIADESQVREVWGFITRADLHVSPFLPDWYGRYGFRILEPDRECLDDAAHKILRMRPTGE